MNEGTKQVKCVIAGLSTISGETDSGRWKLYRIHDINCNLHTTFRKPTNWGRLSKGMLVRFKERERDGGYTILPDSIEILDQGKERGVVVETTVITRDHGGKEVKLRLGSHNKGVIIFAGACAFEIPATDVAINSIIDALIDVKKIREVRQNE